MDSSSDEGEKSFVQVHQGPAAFFFYHVCTKCHICSWLQPEGKVSSGIAICSVGQGSGISVKGRVMTVLGIIQSIRPKLHIFNLQLLKCKN